MTELVSLPVPGTTRSITMINVHGEWMISLRHACDALGITYRTQRAKLLKQPWAVTTTGTYETPDGKSYTTLLMHRRTATMWLSTIALGRVNDTARPIVKAFHEAVKKQLDHTPDPTDQPAKALLTVTTPTPEEPTAVTEHVPATTDPTVSPFDALRKTRTDGSEYWSARDLQDVTEYARWEDFAKIIERARASAKNSGDDVERSFAAITEKPAGGGRPRTDVELSRFGAYLTVMNGDPSMPRIAEAQAYFAIRTREAETATPITAPTPPAPINAPLDPEGQMRVLALAKGLISDDYLETKAKLVAARAMGEAPQIAHEDLPLTVQDYLRAKGVSESVAKSLRSHYGKLVAAAYRDHYGTEPEKRLQTIDGTPREVRYYTEKHRHLFDTVWAIKEGVIMAALTAGD